MLGFVFTQKFCFSQLTPPGVRDPTVVLNALERVIMRVSIGRFWWVSKLQK